MGQITLICLHFDTENRSFTWIAGVDIAGVASSILATPTMTKPVASDEAAGFFFSGLAGSDFIALRRA
jgi:hypothetical protein